MWSPGDHNPARHRAKSDGGDQIHIFIVAVNDPGNFNAQSMT
jgi:hypothetical protein